MEDGFEIPVQYGQTELMLPATLLQTGYTHKFEVLINNAVVHFEPDDEGLYRAIALDVDAAKKIEPALLQAIAKAIQTILQ